MKNFVGNIQSLLIIVLVVILVYLSQCGKKDPVESEVIITTETKWDTVIVSETKYVPKWKVITEVDIDTFTVPVDTTAILKDYFAKYSYVDTLNLDTVGYLILNDTISKNKISSRSFTSKIKIPTTTITIIDKHFINKNEFYWGLGVQSERQQLNYLGGEFIYKNKKRRQYGLGLGINQNFQPVGSARIYWKIGK